ncbi:DUF6498-containing protein [Thiolapillus sp.]
MKLPLAALVAFNLLSLAIALFMGWDPARILFLYWAENVVVALWQIPRFFVAESNHPDAGYKLPNRVFMTVFFLFHYGIFTFVHGMLVFSLFLNQEMTQNAVINLVTGTPGLPLALLGLLLSHGVQFFSDLANGTATTTPLNQVMAQPYKRIVVLHLVVLLSGALLMFLPYPMTSLVLLAVIKTGMDVYMDRKQMKRQEIPANVAQF